MTTRPVLCTKCKAEGYCSTECRGKAAELYHRLQCGEVAQHLSRARKAMAGQRFVKTELLLARIISMLQAEAQREAEAAAASSASSASASSAEAKTASAGAAALTLKKKLFLLSRLSDTSAQPSEPFEQYLRESAIDIEMQLDAQNGVRQLLGLTGTDASWDFARYEELDSTILCNWCVRVCWLFAVYSRFLPAFCCLALRCAGRPSRRGAPS